MIKMRQIQIPQELTASMEKNNMMSPKNLHFQDLRTGSIYRLFNHAGHLYFLLPFVRLLLTGQLSRKLSRKRLFRFISGRPCDIVSGRQVDIYHIVVEGETLAQYQLNATQHTGPAFVCVQTHGLCAPTEIPKYVISWEHIGETRRYRLSDDLREYELSVRGYVELICTSDVSGLYAQCGENLIIGARRINYISDPDFNAMMHSDFGISAVEYEIGLNYGAHFFTAAYFDHTKFKILHSQLRTVAKRLFVTSDREMPCPVVVYANSKNRRLMAKIKQYVPVYGHSNWRLDVPIDLMAAPGMRFILQ
jgi:hypothetical protein